MADRQTYAEHFYETANYHWSFYQYGSDEEPIIILAQSKHGGGLIEWDGAASDFSRAEQFADDFEIDTGGSDGL